MSESIYIALIVVASTGLGSIATIAAQWLSHNLQERAATKRDKPRKALPCKMLMYPNNRWRKLETLMHVIGSDEETTKRFRNQCSRLEDGQPLWGLVNRNQLPEDNC
jgi:hypothetical protein